MASNPELRMRIAQKVRELGTVKADTLGELKDMLDMADVSNTQFGRALRSLHYKYGPVRLNRPLVSFGYGSRPYHLTCVESRQPAVAV